MLALRRETCDTDSLRRKDEQSKLTAIDLTVVADPETRASKELAVPKREKKKRHALMSSPGGPAALEGHQPYVCAS